MTITKIGLVLPNGETSEGVASSWVGSVYQNSSNYLPFGNIAIRVTKHKLLKNNNKTRRFAGFATFVRLSHSSLSPRNGAPLVSVPFNTNGLKD